ARTAHSLLAGVRADPRCVLTPDTLSYADTDLMSLQGHRQDADLYLVELARVNRGTLVTLDRALASRYEDVVLCRDDFEPSHGAAARRR
ncbi:MAG: hypothetical protein WA880_13515, partial [Ornithinimicrobium sp.]